MYAKIACQDVWWRDLPGIIDVIRKGFGKVKILGSDDEVINVLNEDHYRFSIRVL